MSGPKVWVVVTPQEIARLEAERDLLLRELKIEIANWKASLEALEMLTEARIQNTERQLRMIEEAYRGRAFEKGRTSIREEKHRLHFDIEQATIEKKAKEREKRRHLQSVASVVAEQHVRANKPVPSELQKVFSQAMDCSPEDFVIFQNTVNHLTLQLFAPTEESKQTTALPQDFVRLLSSGLTPPKGFESFSSARPSGLETKSKRLDLLMSEIDVLDTSNAVSEFKERAKFISGVLSESQKELLIDSLNMDLSEFCRKKRESAQVQQILSDCRSDLERNAIPQADDLNKQMATALTAGELKLAQQVAARVQAAIVQEECRKAASAKRLSILKAFGHLGYEIKEGMDTAWAKNGRVVLIKPNNPDVGVELGATQNMEKIQLRAVAFGSAPRSDNVDKEIEMTWCTEFGAIRDLLTADGHHTFLEKETPAGSVPVKTYTLSSWLDDNDEQDQRPEERRQVRRNAN